jgi:hypothetical protein
MTLITVPASAEAAAYLNRIAERLTQLFGLSADEAGDRINRFWAGKSLVTEQQEDILFHELPDFWAKTIYHGPGVKWWLDGEE